MADFPYMNGSKFSTYGANTTSSAGSIITSGASANTKGSYTELTASTDFFACGLLANITAGNESDRHYVDIAVGAAGSEQVIIENVFVRAISSREINTCCYFPIPIPAGSRLSARNQSNTGSAAISITATTVGGGFFNPSSFSKMKSYMGGSTSTDGKVYATSGAAVNTKGAYQELTAGVDAPTKALRLNIGSTSSSATVGYLLDIAIGAAGSEVVVISNLVFSMDSTSAMTCLLSDFIPFSVPAGTRISYRAQASTSSATDFVNVAIEVLF